MQTLDATAMVESAEQSPPPGWAVFEWQRATAAVWLVKRLLWALVVTVIAAVAVLALEWVPIDDPMMPALLAGLLVVFGVLFALGPIKAFATASKNVLVVTDEAVAWREGTTVRGHGFTGLTAVKQRLTSGRGLDHEVELLYEGGIVLLLDHRRFGPPGDIAGEIARRAEVEQTEVHKRDYAIT